MKALTFLLAFAAGVVFTKVVLSEVENRVKTPIKLPMLPSKPSPVPAPPNMNSTIDAPIQSDVYADFTA